MKKEGWPKDPKELPQKEKTSRFKIETIQGPKGNEISFSPERGGIITAMKLNGVEVFYMDEETFNDESKNVKGGIPQLIPNSGPLRGEKNPYPDLKQHGFARLSPWRIEHMAEGEFSEVFSSNEETKKIFPYDFEARMKCTLNDDGSITLAQEVKNLGKTAMPLSMGLHPYFKIPHEKKKDIKLDFPEGEKIESKDEFEKWSQDKGTTSVANPKLKDPNAVLRIEIPGLGTLVMDVSAEYQRILVWSLPDKNFVCIEPVMRDDGGLIDDPEMVEPGETFSGKVTFRLE